MVNNRFIDIVKRFEAVMQKSAQEWRKKNFPRAIDNCSVAEKIISSNMPSPLMLFEWRGCMALRTYAVLVSKMIEVDLLISREEKSLAEERIKQIRRWGRLLGEQMNEWRKSPVEDETKRLLRRRWIGYLASCVKHAENYLDKK